MDGKTRLNRRAFLAAGGAVAAAPYFVPGSALGAAGRPAPSEQIVLGHIGVGGMGTANMEAFIKEGDCRVAACCDVDEHHARAFAQKVNEHYGNRDCAIHRDFRELIARPDIDAVCIATPDHWHALPAIAAAEAGKDIYCEKPITHTWEEGRAVVEAVHRRQRVWQTGSWQRSVWNFRRACELVLNGRIGRVYKVEVGLPYGHSDVSPEQYRRLMTFQEPPDHLDYDLWLGPAPMAPYCPGRVHRTWRWNLDTGGGQLMDWIGHHNDIAHWGLGLDRSGPVEVQATGNFPPADRVWNSPKSYLVRSKYADGVEIIIKDAPRLERGGDAGGGHYMGTKWIGEEGWVYVARGFFQTHPKSLEEERIGDDEMKLYESPGHQRNFLDCVKSRQPTLTPVEVAHRSITPGHLGYVSMELGRAVRWDPKAERTIDDPAAQELLGKKMRPPWTL